MVGVGAPRMGRKTERWGRRVYGGWDGLGWGEGAPLVSVLSPAFVLVKRGWCGVGGGHEDFLLRNRSRSAFEVACTTAW